jgi:hypothetical protein
MSCDVATVHRGEEAMGAQPVVLGVLAFFPDGTCERRSLWPWTVEPRCPRSAVVEVVPTDTTQGWSGWGKDCCGRVAVTVVTREWSYTRSWEKPRIFQRREFDELVATALLAKSRTEAR